MVEECREGEHDYVLWSGGKKLHEKCLECGKIKKFSEQTGEKI